MKSHLGTVLVLSLFALPALAAGRRSEHHRHRYNHWGNPAQNQPSVSISGTDGPAVVIGPTDSSSSSNDTFSSASSGNITPISANTIPVVSSSTSTSLAAGSTSGVPTDRPGNATTSADCKCGYTRAGTYLPKLFDIDFTKSNTPELITSAGMFITDTFDYNVGSIAPDGTTAYGQASNIRPAGEDGIAMVVPGGQQAGGKVTAAEMSFQGGEGSYGMTKIVAEVEMLVDATPGTCQSMFTYTADYEAHSDELDIEIISASLMTGTNIADAGVQLTNHDPSRSGKSDFRITPFPQDPSKAFHKYTIAWTDSGVEYLFDGQPWKGPSNFVSVNPSNVIINHWATGEVAFFGAPLPQKDVTMKVKNLKVYYATASTSSMPSGCTEADVCSI